MLELNGKELVENSSFTILDIPIKQVQLPCRRVKVSNQIGSNSNNPAAKHHQSYQTDMMPLPGLEPLRPPSSRDQINKLKIGKTLNQK